MESLLQSKNKNLGAKGTLNPAPSCGLDAEVTHL